jgi:hypothetical protein
MAKRRPYRQHLKSSGDLVTTYEAVRAGFVALALERNRRATPFVAAARALKVAASQAVTPAALVSIKDIEAALLTAAGVSDKAAGHLQPEDKAEAIGGLIKNYLEPAGADFVEELVFRFLLTRGDALGGSMRNVGGAMAQRKLTRTLISMLSLAGITYWWLHSGSKSWVAATADDADIELSLRGLGWEQGKRKRTLIYNLTVPFLKNNVDLCLFNCRAEDLSPTMYQSPVAYVALGELKGGIDLAGADEHWKTARTALARIQKGFAAHALSPHTFFIGAAIEKKMATEIWNQLEEGTLENAANLTDEKQIVSIARWLCHL